jgi:hypothetical protein
MLQSLIPQTGSRRADSLAGLRARREREQGRWYRRAMVVALVALAGGSAGTAAGSSAVEAVAGPVALVALAGGSAAGLWGTRSRRGR